MYSLGAIELVILAVGGIVVIAVIAGIVVGSAHNREDK